MLAIYAAYGFSEVGAIMSGLGKIFGGWGRKSPAPIIQTDLSPERARQYSELVALGVSSIPLLKLMERVGDSPMRYMALIDFGKPSTEKRFFLIDTDQILVESFMVAHGAGHDPKRNGLYAQDFSNENGSYLSSLGFFKVSEVYESEHEFAQGVRLDGLDPTNSHLRARGCVIHKAPYVSEAYAKENGRLGRSDGCLAVSFADYAKLRDALKNGSGGLAYV